jgi:hypothetical protein
LRRIPIPLGDAVAIDHFSKLIAIPPNCKVGHSWPATGNNLSLDIVQATWDAPHLRSWMTRIDIASESSASVSAIIDGPKKLSGLGIE